MAKKAKTELRKLNRMELLELLVAQTERVDRLEAELQEVKLQLRHREDLIIRLGNIAGAGLEARDASVKAKVAQTIAGAGIGTNQKHKNIDSSGVGVPAQAASDDMISVKAAMENARPPKNKANAAPAKRAASSGKVNSPVEPEKTRPITRQEVAARASAQKNQSANTNKPAVRSTQPAQTNANVKQVNNAKKRTNGLDLSAIAAITSGIGEGKI